MTIISGLPLPRLIAPVLVAGFAVALSPDPLSAQTGDDPGSVSPAVSKLTTQASPDVASTASAVYSGRFTVIITVRILSPITAVEAITCSGTVAAVDASGNNVYTENSQVIAARNGNAASCTLSIPYSWSLPSGSTYTAGYTVSATNGSSAVVRSSQFSTKAGTALPANGTGTVLRFAVVL